MTPLPDENTCHTHRMHGAVQQVGAIPLDPHTLVMHMIAETYSSSYYRSIFMCLKVTKIVK